MGFRTVVIKNRCKLDFCLNYMVYRAEDEKRIHLSEISVLIIESAAVAITGALMVELIKSKVKVIFCDEKHLPSFQLVGFYDNYHSSKCILKQISWSRQIKDTVWKNIIFHKIRNQRNYLKGRGYEGYELLDGYLEEIQAGDSTNREGHAAKVYFNEVIGKSGSRRKPSFYNSALNYGYAILLSAFCRSITAAGYITQLGIWHTNEYNPYNLASDFMETYRIIADALALELDEENLDFKGHMANIVNSKVEINGKWQFLEAGIELYVQSLFNALNGNSESLIKNFTDYELSIYENYCNV